MQVTTRNFVFVMIAGGVLVGILTARTATGKANPRSASAVGKAIAAPSPTKPIARFAPGM